MLQLLTTRSIRRGTALRHVSYPAKWEGLVTKELNGAHSLTHSLTHSLSAYSLADSPTYELAHPGKAVSTLEWTTPEGIKIKPLYTEVDVNKDANKESQAAPGTLTHSLLIFIDVTHSLATGRYLPVYQRSLREYVHRQALDGAAIRGV